eukprot:5755943-Amphidinium_carterae.1
MATMLMIRHLVLRPLSEKPEETSTSTSYSSVRGRAVAVGPVVPSEQYCQLPPSSGAIFQELVWDCDLAVFSFTMIQPTSAHAMQSFWLRQLPID